MSTVAVSLSEAKRHFVRRVNCRSISIRSKKTFCPPCQLSQYRYQKQKDILSVVSTVAVSLSEAKRHFIRRVNCRSIAIRSKKTFCPPCQLSQYRYQRQKDILSRVPTVAVSPFVFTRWPPPLKVSPPPPYPYGDVVCPLIRRVFPNVIAVITCTSSGALCSAAGSYLSHAFTYSGCDCDVI